MMSQAHKTMSKDGKHVQNAHKLDSLSHEDGEKCALQLNQQNKKMWGVLTGSVLHQDGIDELFEEHYESDDS